MLPGEGDGAAAGRPTGTPAAVQAKPLCLASASAARAMLLMNAGLEFSIIPAEIDERAVENRFSGTASAIALGLAAEKALAVSRLRPDALVIGADQTLALGEQRFHKPESPGAARAQLLALAGRTHSLHSAVAVAMAGEVLFRHAEEARLVMRVLGEADVDGYLRRVGDSVLQSVGGYQVEGMGVRLFERIEGDHFTIMGLPLLPLLAFLRESGETEF